MEMFIVVRIELRQKIRQRESSTQLWNGEVGHGWRNDLAGRGGNRDTRGGSDNRGAEPRLVIG